MDTYTIEKLKEYRQLVDEGILTQEEFEREKSRLLFSQSSLEKNNNGFATSGIGKPWKPQNKIPRNDYAYLVAAQKLEQFVSGALDGEIKSSVRGRALIGGICMAVPLWGIETIVYAICLWSTYGKIATYSGVPFKNNLVKNIIGGFIINIIMTFFFGMLLDFIPVVGWVGSFAVGYISLYTSGMGFVKMLKKLHGDKAKKDLNIQRGIEYMNNGRSN